MDVSRENGLVLVPVWTGNPFDRYIYQGPVTERITVTKVERKAFGRGRGPSRINVGIGGGSGEFGFNLSGGIGITATRPKRRKRKDPGGMSIAGAYQISNRTSSTPLTLGMNGKTIPIEDVTTVETWERAIAIGSPYIELEKVT